MSRLISALLIAVTSLASVQGATILGENFDELTVQLAATSAGAFTTSGRTNVDIVVGPANGVGTLCASPAFGTCIDLDGTGGNSQGILQSGPITLKPGVNYFLSYDLIGSGRGNTTSATVTFGPYSSTFTLDSGDTSTGIVSGALVTVSSTTTTNLRFASNTPGEVGSILDNVFVRTSTATVPEPSGLFLGLLGLGFVAVVVRSERCGRQKV
jgi:PEP-CTERM motif